MTATEKFIRLTEVANLLDVCPRTVQRFIKEKNLPVHKPGRFLYFYWSEVDKWMKEQKA